MKRQKPSLHLAVRKCKNQGNTYYACKAYIDGRLVAKIPFSYGYERQYEQDMFDLLEANGDIPTQHVGGSRHAFIREHFALLDVDEGWREEHEVRDWGSES